MKITKERLKEIIKEELETTLGEARRRSSRTRDARRRKRPDPFPSARWLKGKLGLPRDAIEKARRRYDGLEGVSDETVEHVFVRAKNRLGKLFIRAYEAGGREATNALISYSGSDKLDQAHQQLVQSLKRILGEE